MERQNRNYSYDANANMTSDGIRTYTWDAENRLVGIGYVDHPEKKSSFQYDGLNRRAVMVETHGSASTTSTFLWDGTDLLMEQTEKETKWYYPQGEIHGKESLFYVSDRLGSVRETVNQDHLITARMSYTAYGETQTTLTPFIGKAPDYRYAGLFFHEQSGLYLAVFRAYDPRAGRWINRDPIGEVGNSNLFSYVNNTPVSATDFSGLILNYGLLPGSKLYYAPTLNQYFFAPPNTSFRFEAKFASWFSIIQIYSALKRGGSFDYQRPIVANPNDNFVNYVQAANYGVGVYECSAGIPENLADYFNREYIKTFDHLTPQVQKKIIKQDTPWWNAGYHFGNKEDRAKYVESIWIGNK